MSTVLTDRVRQEDYQVMTKRRSTRGPAETATRRDLARVRDDVLTLVSPSESWEPLSRLSAVQDSRLWTPESPYKPSKRYSGAPARIMVANNTNDRPRLVAGPGPVLYPSTRLAFRQAPHVLTCVRRTVRRQVMHARGVAGGKVKRPTYRQDSYIRCK